MMEKKNYFQLFNLEEKFNIDEKILEANYIILQNNLHPDRFLSEKEKSLAFNESQNINEAYIVLKSPISRAEYLLYTKYNIENINPSKEMLSKLFKLQEWIDENKPNKDDIKTLKAKYFKKLQSSFEESNLQLIQKNLLFLKYLLNLNQN